MNLETMPYRRGNSLAFLQGYLPYGVPDHEGLIVTGRSFRAVLSAGKQIPVWLAHSPEHSLGVTSELWSNAAGLWFRLAVPDTELGNSFLAARRNGRFAFCSMHVKQNEFRETLWHGLRCEELTTCKAMPEITLTGQPAQPQARNEIIGENCPDFPLSLPPDFLNANRITQLLRATGETDARRTPVVRGRQNRQPVAASADPAVGEMDDALEQFSPQSHRVPQHERDRRDRLAAMLTTIKSKAARGLPLTSAERERLEIVGGVVTEIDAWLRAVGAAA